MQIYGDGNLFIDVLRVGPLKNNIGILRLQQEKSMVIIDAAMGAYAKVKEEYPDYSARYVLLTHEHWDHVWESNLFYQNGATVYGHESAQKILLRPDLYPDNLIAQKLPVCPNISVIKEGETLSLLGISINIIGLDGHAPGDLGYFLPDQKICFVGDTLFAKTVGRSDFPGGNKHLLFKNIREKLYTLPEDTIVVPGHGHLTSIGTEKNENPFVRERLS